MEKIKNTKNRMMKNLLGVISISLCLVCCNDNDSLKKEISELKYQNKKLKKQSLDSVKIYNSIKEDKNQIFAEKFVDSLRKNNPMLLEKIEKEIDNSFGMQNIEVL